MDKTSYGIFDTDLNRFREEGKGLPYSQCIEQGVALLTKGKVVGTEPELLKWLYENHFSPEPLRGITYADS